MPTPQALMAAAMLVSAGTGIYSAADSAAQHREGLAAQKESRDAANVALEEAKNQTAQSKAELKRSQEAQQKRDSQQRKAGAKQNALRALLAAPEEEQDAKKAVLG